MTCIGRSGSANTPGDDGARAAGVGRATVYRHFADGRDQLITESITWEVGQFFAALAAQVADAPDFATRLERALRFGHRAMEEHQVLQKVLETEPERLLPQLTQSMPIVLTLLREYLASLLVYESLRPGITVDAAADWLARMGVSFIVNGGSWDLDDAAEVRRLVRQELLAPILAPEVTPPPR